MSWIEEKLENVLDARLPNGWGGCFYGVYPGVVVNVKDPAGQGRVKVKLPWAKDAKGKVYEAWARLATAMAGGNRGSWFIPDEKDEVLVAFGGGRTDSPFVIGGLWNGKDAPPESMDGDGKNNVKTIRSRNGVKVSMDDTSGKETLVLETPGSQKIVLKDGGAEITLSDASGNEVKMHAGGVSITAASKFKIQASTIEMSAGMVKVDSGMSKHSGAVKSEADITNSVVSSSYTPALGNIL